jgi:hypothetical protein
MYANIYVQKTFLEIKIGVVLDRHCRRSGSQQPLHTNQALGRRRKPFHACSSSAEGKKNLGKQLNKASAGNKPSEKAEIKSGSQPLPSDGSFLSLLRWN